MGWTGGTVLRMMIVTSLAGKAVSKIDYKGSRQRQLLGVPGLILGLRPVNERRRYFLIGWAQA